MNHPASSHEAQLDSWFVIWTELRAEKKVEARIAARGSRRGLARTQALRQVDTVAEIVEIVSNMEVRDTKVDPKLRIDYHARRLPEFYLRLHRERDV